jgi:hypothetical protein
MKQPHENMVSDICKFTGNISPFYNDTQRIILSYGNHKITFNHFGTPYIKSYIHVYTGNNNKLKLVLANDFEYTLFNGRQIQLIEVTEENFLMLSMENDLLNNQ